MHRALGGGGGALDPGDSSDEDYFSDLYCPLTLEVMTDPVVCAGKLFWLALLSGIATSLTQLHFMQLHSRTFNP